MISAQTIISYKKTEPAIFQMQEIDRLNLMEQIPAILSLVGISQKITDDQQEALENLLVSSFGTMTASELKYAIHLYVADEIDVPKEHQHFGAFNLKFIGSLLKRYMDKSREVLKYVPQQVTPVEKQLSSKHAFDECMETYTSMIEELGKSSKLQEFGNFDFSYLFLEVIGEIKLTEEDKTEHIGYVRQIISQEADILQSVELRKEYRGRFQKSPEAFKTKCRDEYFKRWVNEKLTDFITDTGDIDKAELKAWCESEVQRINELNRTGEFNKYRK